MAKNTYDQGGLPAWQSGDTTTFQEQANNLGQEEGTAGLNTAQIQLQQQTADAERKAGQAGQQVAADSADVANGKTPGSPDAKPGGPGGTSQVIINPLPDPNVTNNTDFSKSSNYTDPTQDYLRKLFPGGIPQSVQDAMDKSAGAGFQGNDLSNSFSDYLKGLQNNITNQANSPQDVQQYKNYLQNQLASQMKDIDQAFNNGNTDLATQNSQKQKAISDYIGKLNTGLQDYQKKTQNAANVGPLSAAEQASADVNGVLANDQKTGAEALGALSASGGTNSRLAALSQQAQAGAINQARGEAAAAQQAAKTGAEIQAEGQKAQAKGYTDAGTAITKNQTDTLNKLQESSDKAKQALNDAYNNSKTNLNTQEQDFVNKAQDTLKNAKIPKETIEDATSTFANTVQQYIDKGNLSSDQKNNLVTQLESIWRVAVGSSPGADMDFSNKISGTLLPLIKALGGNGSSIGGNDGPNQYR